MKEVNVAGVYFSPFIFDLILASMFFGVFRMTIYKKWIASHVWHPAAFEAAVFVLILTFITLLLS